MSIRPVWRVSRRDRAYVDPRLWLTGVICTRCSNDFGHVAFVLICTRVYIGMRIA